MHGSRILWILLALLKLPEASVSWRPSIQAHPLLSNDDDQTDSHVRHGSRTFDTMDSRYGVNSEDDEGFRSSGSDKTSSSFPHKTNVFSPSAQLGTFVDEPINDTYVVAQEGTTASLSCRTGNIGDSMVSWTRKRDLYVLTAGLITLSQDKRFWPVSSNADTLWSLRIKLVHSNDTGWYECQISTDPPRSHAVHLTVIRAKGRIRGRSEILVNSGSSLVLVCDVEEAMMPPQFILWYHGSRVINYDDRPELNITKHNRSSRLGISRITPKDSGNYTCAPSMAQNDTTIVHVLNAGENPAAMQDGSASSSTPLMSMRLVAVLSLLAVTANFLHLHTASISMTYIQR